MSIEKLDFKKVTHERKPYTQLLNKVIQNIKDPLAGFIWVYLSSLPQDWKVNKEHIKNKFQLGDNTIKVIFSYLNRAKLIEYRRERLPNGKLSEVSIHVFTGEYFDENEPYKKTTGSKTAPVDKTTGSKTRRVENQTSGSGALQKKQNTNALKNTKTKKSSLSQNQKIQNEKRHSWADSKDQMASEKRHIEKSNEFKSTPMPDSLRHLYKSIRKSS